MSPALLALIGLLILPFSAQGQGGNLPPGIVIRHQEAASQCYIGSPSLCVMPDGSYLAPHDLFAPGSTEHELALGRLCRSTDKGTTWQLVTDLHGYFWTGIGTLDPDYDARFPGKRQSVHHVGKKVPAEHS